MVSEMTEKHTFKNVECSPGVRERKLERSESAFCPGEIGGRGGAAGAETEEMSLCAPGLLEAGTHHHPRLC